VSGNGLVEVLLATYNGERFLREQIESIFAQSYRPLRIVARDDGSRDGTVAILEEYAARFPERFRVLPKSAPTGHAKWNFLRLMEAASAEYVAFADQDDVWLPEKISIEMKAMRELEERHAGEPLLVFSDLTVVDEGLAVLSASMWERQGIDPENVHRFARILAQNVVTGCTALLNRPLLELALRMPEEATMHDWWIAVLACGFGAAGVVKEPTVLYRQHGGNVLGAVQEKPPMGVPQWRFHARRREQWEVGERQAEGILRVYGSELTPQKRALLEGMVRCETNPNRVVRAWTWLRNGYFLDGGWRANLAILWYLWDMKAGKRQMTGRV
jgi:glycosyltransferase involved in cell wall biosynthesis